MRGSNLQDILRLLTLWFNHGRSPDVEAALQEGFSVVSIDTWLMVIPQACFCHAWLRCMHNMPESGSSHSPMVIH